MTRDEVIALAMEVDCLHVNLTGDRDKAAERLQCFAAAIEARVRQDDPALRLVADIRFALGDDGKRMQGELVEYCKELRLNSDRYKLAREAIVTAAHGHHSVVEAFISKAMQDAHDAGLDGVLDEAIDKALDAAMQTQAPDGDQHGR